MKDDTLKPWRAIEDAHERALVRAERDRWERDNLRLFQQRVGTVLLGAASKGGMVADHDRITILHQMLMELLRIADFDPAEVAQVTFTPFQMYVTTYKMVDGVVQADGTGRAVIVDHMVPL